MSKGYATRSKTVVAGAVLASSALLAGLIASPSFAQDDTTDTNVSSQSSQQDSTAHVHGNLSNTTQGDGNESSNNFQAHSHAENNGSPENNGAAGENNNQSSDVLPAPSVLLVETPAPEKPAENKEPKPSEKDEKKDPEKKDNSQDSVSLVDQKNKAEGNDNTQKNEVTRIGEPADIDVTKQSNEAIGNGNSQANSNVTVNINLEEGAAKSKCEKAEEEGKPCSEDEKKAEEKKKEEEKKAKSKCEKAEEEGKPCSEDEKKAEEKKKEEDKKAAEERKVAARKAAEKRAAERAANPGKPLPANAPRQKVKSVPAGSTELTPNLPAYIG